MTKSDKKLTMLATPNNNNKPTLRTLRINARGQKRENFRNIRGYYLRQYHIYIIIPVLQVHKNLKYESSIHH